jgi:transketolase
LPCWEIFETQSPAQRAAILGTGPKIGIEAAVRFGWDQILAPEDPFIGMTGFGASAKAPELFAHFGITTEAIVAAAKARL